MKKRILYFVVFFIVVLFCLQFSLVGCTKYANPDQLKQLDETKAAALSAEKSLEKLRKERKGLERTLAQKKAELVQLHAKRDGLKRNLEESSSE